VRARLRCAVRVPRAAATDLIAPSKLPGLKPKPCPMSCRNRSPSTSRSSATSRQAVSIRDAPARARREGAHTEHRRRDINAGPEVALAIEDLAREARAAADVEQERGRILGQIEQLERTVSHVGLNLLDTRAARVRMNGRFRTGGKGADLLVYFVASVSP
jgi:hypothetical protein